MLLTALKISYYTGSFPYKFDADKKQFVFGMLGFAIFVNSCIFTLLNYAMRYTYSELRAVERTWQVFLAIGILTSIKLLMLYHLKTKLKYFNKLLLLYLEEGSNTYMSPYVNVYYFVLLTSTMSDFVYLWVLYGDTYDFLFKLLEIPNRFLIWAISYQFVAVCIFLRHQFEMLNGQLKELLQGDTEQNQDSVSRLNKFSYKSHEFYSSYNSPNAFNMVLDERANHYSFPETSHRKEIVFIIICRKFKTLKANVKELNDIYSNTILLLTMIYLEFTNISINGFIKTIALTSVFNKFASIKLCFFFFRTLRSIVLLMFLYQTCSSVEDEVLLSCKIILNSDLTKYSQSFLNLIVSFLHNQHVDKTSFTILFGHIGVNLELSLLLMACITPLITISIQTYFYTKP